MKNYDELCKIEQVWYQPQLDVVCLFAPWRCHVRYYLNVDMLIYGIMNTELYGEVWLNSVEEKELVKAGWKKIGDI